MHQNAKDNHSAKEPPRKRVARACDRCRLKKGKCDGKEQCAKCVTADVMCIYTDRKPPQHKLISPAVAEALQSENLTLKKATIILFKQLLEGGDLPAIEGVDWNSEKVANGKSGRALNFIISQQAKVDNRISNEEITSYDSDTQMLDSSRTCPNSPGSRQSSPQSTAGELWNPGYEITQQPPEPDHAYQKKRKARNTEFDYPVMPVTGVAGDMLPATSVSFVDPGLLPPTRVTGSAFSQPPTPPTCDALDFMPPVQIQWSSQQQPHPRFYDQRYVALQTQGYHDEVQAQQARGSGGMACENAWATPTFYQYLGEDKDYGKVYDSMGCDVQMYDRAM